MLLLTIILTSPVLGPHLKSQWSRGSHVLNESETEIEQIHFSAAEDF